MYIATFINMCFKHELHYLNLNPMVNANARNTLTKCFPNMWHSEYDVVTAVYTYSP